MEKKIEIKNLTKNYGDFKLEGINLDIPCGYITGLIGENGAGKTTLIKSILDITHLDSGSIKLNGKDISNYKEDIGVVLDNTFFPEVLTAKDIGNIMKNVYKTWDANLYNKYLSDFKLELNKKIKTFSKGMRKKLEIVVALSHKPHLLILDEPTSGLDQIVRDEILDIFLNFVQDEEHTILISTHITSDLEKIADYITFINDGKILLNDNKDDILENYGILKCEKQDFDNIDKSDIIKYKNNKYSYEILIKLTENIRKKYKKYVIDKPSLDEIMVLYVRGEE